MRLGKYHITWFDRSSSEIIILSISGDWSCRALLGLWMSDGIHRETMRTKVDLYLEILFFKFKILTIQV